MLHPSLEHKLLAAARCLAVFTGCALTAISVGVWNASRVFANIYHELDIHYTWHRTALDTLSNYGTIAVGLLLGVAVIGAAFRLTLVPLAWFNLVSVAITFFLLAASIVFLFVAFCYPAVILQ